MSDHLKLLSLYDEPRCTILVRPDAQVYYEMKYENERTTLLRGPSGGQAKEGTVAGYINWHKPSTMGLAGFEPSDTGAFLRRTTDSTRAFTGPYGEEYIWTADYTGGLELHAAGSSQSEPIAVFRTERVRMFKKNERAHLDISSQGQNILDYVILTWVFMRKIYIDNRKSEDRQA